MKDLIKNVCKIFILFAIGGFIYYLIEIIYRGYSHWTMIILGGVCFIAIGSINEFISWELLFLKQCIIGSIIVTFLEFITGCIVNICLIWNVWDYSNVPFNILGQICVPFSLIWIIISGIAIILDDWLRYYLFNEEKPHYRFR